MTGAGQDGQLESHGLQVDGRLDAQPVVPPAPTPAQVMDVVVLLHRLTSFMALRDPQLLVAAATAVGADTLIPPFLEVSLMEGSQAQMALVPDPKPWRLEGSHLAEQKPDLDDESKLQLQEAELARLHYEVETTKRRIAEVRLHVEAVAVAGAEHAQQAAEASRR